MFYYSTPVYVLPYASAARVMKVGGFQLGGMVDGEGGRHYRNLKIEVSKMLFLAFSGSFIDNLKVTHQ